MATDPTQMPPTTIDLTGLPAPVVDQVLRIVEEARRQLAEEASGSTAKARLPLRGRFEHLGYSIPKEVIDEAQREAWAGFPRDFPEPPRR